MLRTHHAFQNGGICGADGLSQLRVMIPHSPVEHEHAAGASDGDGKVPLGQLSQVLLLQRGCISGVSAAVADPENAAAAAAASARRH